MTDTAPTTAQLETLAAHLRRFTDKDTPCPVCSGKSWAFVGITTLRLSAGEPTPTAVVRELVSMFGPMPSRAVSELPCATLVCNTCFHVRSFAWKPIDDRKATPIETKDTAG